MGYRLISLRSSDGTAHTNSTTEAVLDSVLIPAGSLMVGKVYNVKGKIRATATNSTDTLTVLATFHTSATTGGTTIGTSGAVDAADNDVVYFDIDLIPQSAAGSSAGTIEVCGSMSVVGAEGTVTMRAVHHALSSINYLANQYFVVTGDWSVASASNSCVSESLYCAELS